MTLDLFEPDAPTLEPLEPGAMVLRRFACRHETALLAAVQGADSSSGVGRDCPAAWQRAMNSACCGG